MPSILSSYWKVFRIFFVIFSLYLVGDAFYRWDGFSYYASFSDFIPNLCLVSILWSVLAGLTAFIVWIPVRIISFCCRRAEWKMAERLSHFVLLLVSLAGVLLLLKRIIWLSVPVPMYLKLIIALGLILAAICIDWVLHKKYDMVQERLTPLVWIFGLLIIISIPVVAYHATAKESHEKISQSPAPDSALHASRPNILLITFDALTSEDMSVYGYHKPTTPFFSEWSKKASLFLRLKATSNYTAPTTSSLITGKRIWTHRVFQPHAYKIEKGDTENIPRLLKQNGYFNMAYVANLFAPLSRNKIEQYFDLIYKPGVFMNQLNTVGLIDLKLHDIFRDNLTFSNWIIDKDFIFGKFLRYASSRWLKENKGRMHYSLEKMFDKIVEDIDTKVREPFFAWMHIWQPHGPYLPPEPYKGMFGPDTGDIWESRDRYDELIRYCDEEFKNFIKELEERGVLENTVIIVSSDHGESFEHNYIAHGGPYLYEQVTNIPLIIKAPGREDGQAIDAFVEQIDIPATILDFAGISVPSWIEGRSLKPLMNGEKIEEKLPLSMNFEQNPRDALITKGVIAIWEDDYKLIHDIGKNQSMLFNLRKDPAELENIYNEESDVGRRMLEIIKHNLDTANAKY